MGLKVLAITLLIIPYVRSFKESLMSHHISDKISRRMLQYEHHQENYRNSLLHGIVLYGLQLKKSAQIETTSPDFPAKWSNILYEAEHKLVNLLLHESKIMYEKMENKFEQVLRAENPVDYTDIIADIIERNVTLKITLRKRSKNKWRKFKRKKRVVRQPKRSSNNVLDFTELALQRSIFKNVTENRKQRKKERRDLQREKNDLFAVEISDVSSLNEAMQSTSASSSSHGMISDASTVKICNRILF